MGVDYYTCHGCNIGYRDDSPSACYCDCGNNFCNKDCGKLDNYEEILEEPDENSLNYQDWIDVNWRIYKDMPITCVICRNEKFTNYSLLCAVLKHFNITRDQAINIWRENNER